MSFVHPFALILLLLPLTWMAWLWRSSVHHAGLLLKSLSIVAVVFALAEPSTTLPQTRTAAVILVDTSSSITRDDLNHAASLIAEIRRHQGGNWMKIVPFAGRPRPLLPQELAGTLRLVNTASEGGNSTNIESALTSSMSAIPSGYIPRLVLLTDGNQNEGSAARAIAELEGLHVPVDTIPLSGRQNTGFHLESLSIPRLGYTGEQIPLDLTIDAPQDTRASISISAEGKDLGSNPVELKSGANLVRVHARVNSSGATSISGVISSRNWGEIPFEQAIELRRAKVLYLSQDPPGTETNLMQAFSEADFDLTRDASLIEKDLSGVQLVILNNLDLNILSAAQKHRLDEYVKDGGGLLLIGGERQIYKEDKQLDALDNVLPAKLAPPKTPEGTCVALIIDKSSSMEGRKIELARLSAIGVVDHLRPIDSIGVLIFDNSFQWAVPMRRAEDKSLIKRLISGITPDGGTQIAPALTEAYKRVLSSKAIYKHIVLLTDGISEEGDSMDLAKEALGHQITISTVGLGQDVNRSYLEKVATTAGGKSYFLNEPQGLEQILLKDVQEYSGSTAVEKPLNAMVVNHDAEILRDVGMDTAPPLKGYARYVAKPAAETVLSIDAEKNDPLYVRWQYGLGRAAVFASDAKSRWAENWVAWPGFDKFWINVTRDLLPHADRSEASAQFDPAKDDLLVTYHLGARVTEPATIPAMFVLGPNGFQRPITIARIAPRLYSGRLHIGHTRGLFRIRPLNDASTFPEIGLYRQQDELQDYGSNEALLQQISAFTGGRFRPSPDAIFNSGGRRIYTTWQLWPALLGLAIALNVAELIVRKWSGLAGRFRRAS
ncbi:MAG: VWA domain-containing protein [Acidobacteriaceae bacterium]|nr:VWA domain-containing protein [Acidobacteriaceae bacterium]